MKTIVVYETPESTEPFITFNVQKIELDTDLKRIIYLYITETLCLQVKLGDPTDAFRLYQPMKTWFDDPKDKTVFDLIGYLPEEK